MNSRGKDLVIERWLYRYNAGWMQSIDNNMVTVLAYTQGLLFSFASVINTSCLMASTAALLVSSFQESCYI